MNKIAQHLQSKISGSVYDQPRILRAYSSDYSLFSITPKLVAVPETTEDVRILLKEVNAAAAKGFRLPVAIYGSGHGRGGVELTDGLVISMERLQSILELDTRGRLICVQAGATLGKINTALAAQGLTLPVDLPPEFTIGEIISSAMLDPQSKKFGGIFYFVERLEVALANGTSLHTTSYNARGLKRIINSATPPAETYRLVHQLVDQNLDPVQALRAMRRNFSGYRLLSKVHKKNFDLTPLFFGAENTLGVITEVILRVEPLSPPPVHILVSFHDLSSLIKFAQNLKIPALSQINFYPTSLFQNYQSPELKTSLEYPFQLLLTFHCPLSKLKSKLKVLQKSAKDAYCLPQTSTNSQLFLKLRSLLLDFYNSDQLRPALVDDFYLPLTQLEPFLSKLSKVTDQPVFGSLSSEIFRFQPTFDLSSPAELKQALKLLQFFHKLVNSHQGSLVGSSSGGRLKALITNPLYSEQEKLLYQNLKTIFDPHNILSPHLKMGSNLSSVRAHLRSEPPSGVIRL